MGSVFSCLREVFLLVFQKTLRIKKKYVIKSHFNHFLQERVSDLISWSMHFRTMKDEQKRTKLKLSLYFNDVVDTTEVTLTSIARCET